MADEWSYEGLCRLAVAVYVGLDEAEKAEWRKVGERMLMRIEQAEARSRRAARRMGYMEAILVDGRRGRRWSRRK